MFSDIPDTSRAYGDVDLVKVYAAVTTEDDEPLLGSVFSLGRLPEDPSVNITLFTTKDWFDTRKDALNTLESYLAPSVKIEGELLENQLKGQQVIQIILTLDGTVPAVGKSLYIVQNEGLPTMFEQYVFVTSVQTQERTFRVGSGTASYKVATLEISTKLDFTFNGVTPSNFHGGLSGAAVIRDTRVADTANYYTSKPLLESVTREGASVKVEDIFTQLVPSARQDKPLSGLTPTGSTQAVIPVGVERMLALPDFTVNSSVTYNVGTPITPSTLKLTLGTAELVDDNGTLRQAGVPVGFVDYETGILSWLASYTPTQATLTIAYIPATIVPTINASIALEVTEGNRGLTLPWTLETPPLAGSLVVTYVVLGDIYTLRDQGGGTLIGANDSFGVGRINYETGDLLLTFGSEPDVGSHVLLTWATNNGVSNLALTPSDKLGFVHTLPIPASGKGIDSNSIVVTWGSKTATVEGNVVSGDASGTYNPKTRTLVVEPSVLPEKGTAYNISYEQQPLVSLTLEGNSTVALKQMPTSFHNDEAIVLDFFVDVSDPDIMKGTFVFELEVNIVMNLPFTASYGRRTVEFFEGDTTGDIGKLYFNAGIQSYSETGVPSTDKTPVEVGTINYLTGAVRIVPTAAQYTWWEQEYDMVVASAYAAPRYRSN